MGGAAQETGTMAVVGRDELDEASLQKRLEAQKLLVARLVAEGKDATNANATLYELGKALEDRRKTNVASAAQ